MSICDECGLPVDECNERALMRLDDEKAARMVHLRERIAELEAAIRTVVETFDKDEAQGYRSRDRQFAISILKPVIGR